MNQKSSKNPRKSLKSIHYKLDFNIQSLILAITLNTTAATIGATYNWKSSYGRR